MNRSLVSGAIRFQGSDLSFAERHAVAEFVSGKKFEPETSGKGMCAGKASGKPVTGEWNGWSSDPENSRFQSAEAAGIAADLLPKLKLKWAFGFQGDFVTFSQPTIVSGRLYVGSARGTVYALDAATGCTYWALTPEQACEQPSQSGWSVLLILEICRPMYTPSMPTPASKFGRPAWTIMRALASPR